MRARVSTIKLVLYFLCFFFLSSVPRKGGWGGKRDRDIVESDIVEVDIVRIETTK